MRFMMLVKANEESESGALPSREIVAKMHEYNEQLVQAGVLLAADGLHSSSKGFRIKFDGGKTTVTDGPFAETKELLAGFWIIQVKTREEALAWASRVPFDGGSELEVRQVFEPEDFPADVLPPEQAAQEMAWRDTLSNKPIE